MTRVRPITDTITVHVPFRLVKRGGRKEMVLPIGRPVPRNVDDTLVKALARAFRWKRMLESGEFGTISDLAQHERIAAPYLTRVFRLAFLAPEVVEAILDGRQPPSLSLEVLRDQLPVDWLEQRALLGMCVMRFHAFTWTCYFSQIGQNRTSSGGGRMQILTAKDAKYGFGRLIDLARAEPVAVAKHGRTVVVLLSIEEYERLKALDAPGSGIDKLIAGKTLNERSLTT